MQFKQNVRKEINKALKNEENKFIENEAIDNDFINNLKNNLFDRYDISINKSENSFSLLIHKIINKMELKKLEDYEDYIKINYSFCVSRNLSKEFTKITI